MLRPSDHKGVTSMTGRIFRMLCGVLWVVPVMPWARAPAAPIFLAFLNAPHGRAPLRVLPRLLVSFGGSPGAAVVDTGSTGIVMSASAISDVPITICDVVAELHASPSWARLEPIGFGG
jgi:hypothetical protein